MQDINLDEVERIFKSVGCSNINKNIINEKIEIIFDEGFILFKVYQETFQILKFNIYQKYRFNPDEDFKSFSSEIIEGLISYLKRKNFKVVEALNIIHNAVNFWERLGFELSDDKKTGIYILKK